MWVSICRAAGSIVVLIAVGLLIGKQGVIQGLLLPHTTMVIESGAEAADPAYVRDLSLRYTLLMVGAAISGAILALWPVQVKRLYLEWIAVDRHCEVYSRWAGRVFIASTLIVTTISFLNIFRVQLGVEWLFEEDRLMENLTVILFFAGALFIAASLHDVRRAGHVRSYRFLIVLILVFLFVAFEEISWGQRLVGWETPGVFKDVNRQGEFNVHNLFNEYFGVLYTLPALLLVIMIVGAWMNRKRGKDGFNWIVLPHASLGGIALVIAIFSLPPLGPQPEVQEESLALFCFLYAWRLKLICNLPH
jgi:hypothetical protein